MNNPVFDLFHSIKDIIPSKSELLEIYGKLNINQFEILDDCAEDVLGSGLYLAASIIGKYPTQILYNLSTNILTSPLPSGKV